MTFVYVVVIKCEWYSHIIKTQRLLSVQGIARVIESVATQQNPIRKLYFGNPILIEKNELHSLAFHYLH